MKLLDELFKLRIICSDPLFIRYRHHPVQLRMVARARNAWSSEACANAKEHLDRLVYRNYID